ncbi:MAG: GTPase HflX [Lachnospiraceae bacterium]|nr:GTPase HflX [Lachnospiraceae bacterium]
MSEMIDIYEEQEKVILVAVELNENDDTESSLDELKELTDTVGALTVGRLIQKRDALQSGTYIGKGKVEELKEMIADTGATGIICDDELSPAQMKNLEELLETKIMDRTMLILDIFARHASTAEGKLQVEAAQLKYRLVRLVGLRSSMSRVSYGIGMRGPGEKKLEVDRRNIRNRISRLDEELKELQKNRSVSRARRMKSGVPVVAIVGYTNAGKSTLLNRLTGADILSADMLFATLDPTTRSYRLPGGQEVLLTDTVGFIRKLPHHLIDAFHSTLEEACYADIIIHMVDASNPEAEKQMSVVYETLKKLGVKEKPIITVFNKQDIAESQEVMKDLNANVTVKASAHTGLGMDELAKNIEKIILQNRLLVDTVLDFKDAGIVQQIRKEGALLEEEYLPSGIKVRAYVPKDLYGKIQSEINNR